MAKVFSESVSVLDTEAGTFNIDTQCDRFTIQVFGAGSGSVQATIDGSTDIEAYTVSDSGIDLRMGGVEKFVITAFRGAIEAQVFGYRD